MRPLCLADPDAFADGVPHERLAELRRAEPVSWQEMDGEPGFFAILAHADVHAVSQAPELFSSSAGGIMLEDPTPESLELSRDMLVVMDPPRHGGYRKPVSPSFKRSAVAGMEHQIRRVCRQIMDEARAEGPEVELVHEVSSKLPSRVVGRLMGLPVADWPRIHHLSEQMLAGQDPDVVVDGDQDATVEMVGYAMAFAASRRTAEPIDDVTDVLLTAEFDGHLMTDLDYATFFVQLVAAGNDTTRYTMAAGMKALIERPDTLAELRDATARPGDESTALVTSAVEEILRWGSVTMHFRRTATRDTELHGRHIRAGDKVLIWFVSADYDDAVFADPFTFDIRRAPNPQVAFGLMSPHLCLGAQLARLEIRVLLEELLPQLADARLAGPIDRLRSNFVAGIKRLPIAVTPA